MAVLPKMANYTVTSAGISGLRTVRRRSLPFVNVVDGSCPELLFRELLDGVFGQPAMINMPSQNWSWWLKFGACVTGCISGAMARDTDSQGERRH
ncbi:hypothetical protein IVB14_30520 [Bradyrhizobium sp. 180]|uniref:hypothetical protein n=1 Tax=Bradyrhizobium sp. 180 TaxID=2782650 RepID=UPI001FFC156F|nr:hypothetical protein [Bradyrhizobium sp. 180]MCK1494630.1 hypothetical protein [Bradyrhizobium sp. 180]